MLATFFPSSTNKTFVSIVVVVGCDRCKRDNKEPKAFFDDNDMDPGGVPPQLRGLTQVEDACGQSLRNHARVSPEGGAEGVRRLRLTVLVLCLKKKEIHQRTQVDDSSNKYNYINTLLREFRQLYYICMLPSERSAERTSAQKNTRT